MSSMKRPAGAMKHLSSSLKTPAALSEVECTLCDVQPAAAGVPVVRTTLTQCALCGGARAPPPAGPARRRRPSPLDRNASAAAPVGSSPMYQFLVQLYQKVVRFRASRSEAAGAAGSPCMVGPTCPAPREQWGFPSLLGGFPLNTRISVYYACIRVYERKYTYNLRISVY